MAAGDYLVAIIGLGGVGSHCAHALVRAGVRRLRLVDFDRVSLSSLNRHAVATRSDIGVAKVATCAAHFHAIAPECAIDDREAMFNAASAETLLASDQGPTFVVDCIDDVPTKADLLSACVERGLCVVSALGSGAKGDPTQLCVARGLRDVENDPLGTKLRTTLRGRGVNVSDVSFIYSAERPSRTLLPLSAEQRQAPDQFGNVANFRLRIVPVLGPQPALAGIALALEVLAQISEVAALLKRGPPPPLGPRLWHPRAAPVPHRTLAERLLDQLRKREAKRHCARDVDLTVAEVCFLVHEVWRGRSALNDDLAISGASGQRFTLARWDAERPATVCNVILVTIAEAEAHRGPDSVSTDVRERVEAALRWAEASVALPLCGAAAGANLAAAAGQRENGEEGHHSVGSRRSELAAAAVLAEPVAQAAVAAAAAAESHKRPPLAPPPPPPSTPPSPPPPPSWPVDRLLRRRSPRDPVEEHALVAEQLSRSEAFLGAVGHARVRAAFVVVVGAGATGSAAAALLLRAGVGRLRLVDDGVVPHMPATATRRHALAARADAGSPKAEVCRHKLLAILPCCDIEAVLCRFTTSTAGKLLAPAADGDVPSLVLDCVGGVAGKAEVLRQANERGFRAISVVSAPGAIDPTRVAVAPLSEVHGCPSAVALRLEVGVPAGFEDREIDVVFSHELGQWSHAPAPSNEGRSACESLLRFSLGVAAAAVVLHRLAGETPPWTAPPGHGSAWKKLERRRARGSGLHLDVPAVGCVFEQIWRGRSALSRCSGELCLARWDRSRPPGLANTVVLTEAEAELHDAATAETGSLPRALLAAAGASGSGAVPMDEITRQQLRAHCVVAQLRLHLDSAMIGTSPAHLRRSRIQAAVEQGAVDRAKSVPLSLVAANTWPRVALFVALVPIALAAIVRIFRPVIRRCSSPSCARLPTTAVATAGLGFGVVMGLTAVAPRRSVAAAEKLRGSRDHIVGAGFAGLVGKTPLVELHSLSCATNCRILAKAEFLSPGGCQKDRAARQMLVEAEARGELRPGATIVEGTSGSTGISLALAAAAKGYRVHIVMPDDQAEEKVQLVRRFGATVELVRPASITSPENYVNVARRRAAELNAIPGGEGAFFADQFDNPANFRAHFEGTGPELWEQCGCKLDAFVMSAGTGGTISGVGHFLRGVAPGVQVWLADVPGSSLYGKVAHGVLYAAEQAERTVRRHRTDTIAEGIGLDRLTKNFCRGLSEHNGGVPVVDAAMRVSDQESLEMGHFLLQHEGLFVGSSAAVNCVGAVKVARALGEGTTIATVLCDSGIRHLTKFYNPEVWPEYGLERPKLRERADLSFVQ